MADTAFNSKLGKSSMPLGVIEGFYGREWSWEERSHMVTFLSTQAFSSYWYAPKADLQLRKQWFENWDETTFSHLFQLSCHCQDLQIQFGIGLSPLGLYQEWRKGHGRDQLQTRLQQIAALKPKGLALLFDDMQGDLPELAQTQADIAHFVASHVDVEQLILCPSYYSFDPVLEQLFGNMPENYWKDLGSLLDSSVDLFWTGDKVISLDYPAAGLQTITQLFGRQPVIWDNSIVNDVRKTSPFLTVRAMYDPQPLAGKVRSILVNPMNAPAISQIPLSSLQMCGTEQQRFHRAVQQCAPELEVAIMDCLDLFSVKGRDQLTSEDVARLDQYFRQSSSPVARNIMAWLDGAYRFDPLCLT